MSFTVTATETQKYQLYILATTEEKGKNKATYSQTYFHTLILSKYPFGPLLFTYAKCYFSHFSNNLQSAGVEGNNYVPIG